MEQQSEHKFKSGDVELFYQSWPAESPKVNIEFNSFVIRKAIVILVHGLGDHSGHYMTVVNHFSKLGFQFYGYDQRGHGQSPGKRVLLTLKLF